MPPAVSVRGADTRSFCPLRSFAFLRQVVQLAQLGDGEAVLLGDRVERVAFADGVEDSVSLLCASSAPSSRARTGR